MPLLLYSYLASEMLAPFFASLLVLNGVLFAGRLMQVFDLIFSLNVGLADFVRICACILPALLLFSLPMASSMGVIIGFTRLNNDNEVIALKSAGIGILRMLPPVLLMALAASLLTGYCATRLIPAGSIAMKNLMLQLAKEKIDQGLQERRFSEGTGDIVFYVDAIDEDKTWHGVYVNDLRDREKPVLTLAATGSLDVDLDSLLLTLSLKNGSLHRAEGDVTQDIAFENYTLNIPFQAATTTDDEPQYHKNKNRLSQSELLAEAAMQKNNPYMANYYLVEYHKRLVLSAGCFIITALGMPVALLTRPGRRHLGIPLGLGFFLLYYVTVSAAKGLCDDTTLPVAVVMWTPNVLFSVAAGWIYLISARENWDRVGQRLRFWAARSA